MEELPRKGSSFLTAADGESHMSHSRPADFPPGNWRKLSHLQCTALHCIALITDLHCTALHCTAPELYCAALHRTALNCTALHWIALLCTALRSKEKWNEIRLYWDLSHCSCIPVGLRFSLNWPTGPIQSLSRNICEPSVCANPETSLPPLPLNVFLFFFAVVMILSVFIFLVFWGLSKPAYCA